MLIKKGKVTFAQSQNISTLHAFLSRTGGVSPAPFDSLNMDIKVGDNPKNVRKNKEIAAKTFNLEKSAIMHAKQVHGENVLIIEKENNYETVESDALITNVKGIAIGILTADCLPILIYDPVNSAIGAAHAGWKGTVKNIAAKTIEAMEKTFGSTPEKLLAAMGPSIGQCCYTVGEEVLEALKEKNIDPCLYVKDKRISLSGLNMGQVVEAGVPEKNISIEKICTACRNDLFFSYRKDGKITGRQMSFIML